MKNKIELLAPGGDIDSIKAAIVAGTDAIYCGLDKFNARNRAENITFDDLNGILRLAHAHDCQVFLTLNIIFVESEIPALVALLNKLANTKIDGVIIQDFGMFYLLTNYFPDLKIHASTQLTTHNEGQIQFLGKLAATRVNLSRELNIDEVKQLTSVAHENGLLTEVFIHGSNCICFSGLCYMSSVNGGNSGNRGRCSQPCRDQYLTTPEGKDFPLNMKDNSAYSNLAALNAAGVDSLKIEGRIKKFHYVYTVVNVWRKHLQRLYDCEKLNGDKKVIDGTLNNELDGDRDSDLYRVFNRDFTNSFLEGNINKSMFIDNPRDNSAAHLSETYGGATFENIGRAKRELYEVKSQIISEVEAKIDTLSIERAPLTIAVSGTPGTYLELSINTPDASFVVTSDVKLTVNSKDSKDKKGGRQSLSHGMLLKRLKALHETEYFIERLNLEDLQSDLFIPYKELTSIKKKILFVLHGSKKMVDPIETPLLKTNGDEKIKPALSLLISSLSDLHLCDETTADIYFQLPDSFKNDSSEFLELFRQNERLLPWFPSVIIGEDYRVAMEFLQQLQPSRIVTNNTGIAYAAYRQGIPWIAGPQLNIVNSFSIKGLKENFNCSGSFISNEIKEHQIRNIKRPDNFDLYYSIYHPIVLMTSRLCLFQQVTGCEKSTVDDTCIHCCEKSTSITNMKGGNVYIEKSKGRYHSLYNDVNFLNTDIVTDLPDVFSCFLVDLRDVATSTRMKIDKLKIVELFENHLNGDPASNVELTQSIHPTTNIQFVKGI